MTPERYQRIREVFHAVAAATPHEAETVLREQCAGDDDLRREVESLLADHTCESAFLETPALGGEFHAGAAESWTGSIPRGRHIGKYEVIGPLGEGGMSVVYEAVDPALGRTLALKLLRQSFAAPRWRRRFAHEVETVSRLQHPGIAQLYEAGVAETDIGAQPFCALELVRGRPLDTYADLCQLGTRDRLRLLLRVCDAVRYAHQHGVIHRDLKPANVLVTEAGQPKVLDFGIARIVGDERDATLTQSGQIVGTIGHMSPEQAAGETVDTRTDVYALGVMAYRLLTGQPPHDVASMPVPRAIETVRTRDPVRPSTIDRALRGDLETILLKALARLPDERYQSVSEFAADIERFLDDRPILARAPSAWYQARKFARRHRAFVVSAGAIVLVLVAAAAISTAFAISEARQRRETARALDDLREVTSFQQAMLERIDLAGMGETLSSELRRQAAALLAAGGEPPTVGFEDALGALNLSDAAAEILATHMLGPAVEAIDRAYVDRPVVAAALRQSIGETYRQLGRLGAALTQTRAAFELRRDNLGPNDKDTLWSMTALALTLSQSGDDPKAEPLYAESLERHRRVLGPEHWATLNTSQNYATMLVGQGRFDEALPLAEHAASAYRRGDDQRGLPAALNTLAFVSYRLGRYEEALDAGLEAYRTEFQARGASAWSTHAVRSNVGLFLWRLGRHDEAIGHLQASAAALRDTLGASHPRSVRADARLALARAAAGELERADELSRTALDRVPPGSLGPAGQVRVEALAARAEVLLAMHKPEDAGSALREALLQAEQSPSPWISVAEIRARLEEITG